MRTKIFGFTLSEILIALSVIGVIASLTIPQLAASQRATTTKAQFETVYASLAKSVANMELNGKVDLTDIDAVYAKLTEETRVTVDCSLSGGPACPNETNYRGLDSNDSLDFSINRSFIDEHGAAIMLSDGFVGVNDEEESESTDGEKEEVTPYEGMYILIDVNGVRKRPNRMGYDLFVFKLDNQNGLTPVTTKPGKEAEEATEDDLKKYCCVSKVVGSCTGAQKNSGYTCSYFASNDADYFKKIFKGH